MVCTGNRHTSGGYKWKYAKIEVPKKDNEWDTWKQVDGYPYRVSKDGRVYSEWRKKLLNYKPRGGYIKITLCGNNKKLNTGVHRLVAEAYIPNPDKLPLVNHIDGNKSNNKVENLEWTTYKGNTQHAYDNNLVSRKRRSNHNLNVQKPNARKVGKYKDGVLLQEYKSIASAARDMKIYPSNISCVCSGGKQKTCRGFVWKFLD